MMSFTLASALAVLAAIAVAAPANMDYSVRASKTSGTDLFSSLNKSKNFDVLRAVLSDAGLGKVLMNTTNATILAPTDAAFAATLKDLGFTDVAAGQTKRLLNFTREVVTNQTVNLEVLLTYHVIDGYKNLTELNNMTDIVTLAGASFKLTNDNGTFTDAANGTSKLTGPKMPATNGIIYEISKVLLPKELNKNQTEALAKELEKKLPAPTPVCFPASSIVHTADGQDITMADLAAGHAVKVSENSQFSPVFLFSHKEHQGLQDFVRVNAVTGHSITLTPSHYMYANGKLVAARAVKVGDKIRTVKGPATVKSVEMVKDFGLVAPHTMHGDIVVNGVVASTYTTAVHPRLAHFLLAPVRAVVHLGLSKEPLGSAMYNGAPRFSKMVPSGPDMF